MFNVLSTKKTLSNLFNGALAYLSILAIMFAAVFSAQAAETTIYYHTDLLGSPVASSNETGSVVWKETYKPYGERVINDPEAADNTLWYTGKPHDNSTGLSYYGARYYDPVIGRFMAIDPVGFQEGNPTSFNRYAYANNNPYKYVDPDGNSAIDLVFLAADIGKLAGAVYSGTGIGAAVVDVGLSLVGVASPIPGVGQTLKGLKVLKATAVTKRGSKGPDFIVGSDGAAVVTSQSRMRKGFDDAGFDSQEINNGMAHIVPTPKGNVQVRTMEGGLRNARTGEVSKRRAVITTPGTQSARLPGGGTPQGTKQQHREASHFDQTQ